jgi:hypothetical protein
VRVDTNQPSPEALRRAAESAAHSGDLRSRLTTDLAAHGSLPWDELRVWDPGATETIRTHPRTPPAAAGALSPRRGVERLPPPPPLPPTSPLPPPTTPQPPSRLQVAPSFPHPPQAAPSSSSPPHLLGGSSSGAPMGPLACSVLPVEFNYLISTYLQGVSCVPVCESPLSGTVALVFPL